MAQLLFLQSENDRTPVHMYINSPGDLIKIKGTFKHTVANYCCYVGKKTIRGKIRITRKVIIYCVQSHGVHTFNLIFRV